MNITSMQKVGYVLCLLFATNIIASSTKTKPVEATKAIMYYRDGSHQAGTVIKEGDKEYFCYLTNKTFTRVMITKRNRKRILIGK